MTPEDWQKVRPLLESALELDSAERFAFLDKACAEPSLRQELESLIAAHDRAATGLLNEGARAGSVGANEDGFRLLPGARVGSYEILNQIAVGGMGAVYCAVRADGQYKQQVALKIVRAEFGAELTAKRFRNERQILASLDHSNIGKLLDGGATANGLPYFVMEFIDGLPITEYCERHRLTIEARLKIFRTVSSAVHYAHQHLVIHRDIKPSNILVTSDGEPKLLDFGIAKILDPGLPQETPTRTADGLWMMTPEYASPEQFRGEPITTATDVYSLGLVLYELLTGRHAYRFSSRMPHDIARVVLETDPEKPSTAIRHIESAVQKPEEIPRTLEPIGLLRAVSIEKQQKRLTGDLDNIVMKAIRKEALERYTSVDQFSEDIRRHLQGLPVIARKNTLIYRYRKYVQRHKVGVTASALVFLSLLTGLALTTREARIAERRFTDVRNLANALMFDVHDSIKDLPGSTTARKVIIEKALMYLDSLAQESRNDAGLQRELAAGYKRIGDVQGYQGAANMGETASALASYRKALAIRQGLRAAHPANLEDALAYSDSLQDLAQTLLATGDTTGALKNVQEAIAISEQMEVGHTDDIRVLSQLKNSYETAADILAGTFNMSNLGETTTALSYRQKELNITRRTSAVQPNDPEVQRSTAVSVVKMGDLLLLTGQEREALGYYQDAEKSVESLAARSPNAHVLDNLHGIYTRLQQIQMWQGNPNEAVATNRKALELALKLSREDPSNSYEKVVVAGDYGNLADSLSRSGVKEESISFADRARKLMSEMVVHNPSNTEYSGMQAAEFVTSGDVYRRFRDYRQAQRNYREALSISLKIQAADPNNADVRLRIAATETELGVTLLQSGDLAGAAETYKQALQITEPQTNSNHASEDALYTMANVAAGMGDIERAKANDKKLAPGQQRAHSERARSWYQRSLNFWSQVKEPGYVSPEGFEPVPPADVSARLATVSGKVSK